VRREFTGGTAVWRAISTMGFACALAGILLGGVSVEMPGLALGAAGYGFATRASDRAGETIGIRAAALNLVSMGEQPMGLSGLEQHLQ
jgi:hypothetical protein